MQNPAMDQRIGEVRLADGTPIAVARAGSGPALVYVPGWLTHLEHSWALPAERAFYSALAEGRTLHRYDKAGCGLSGPADRAPSLELEDETLSAVVEAAGSGPVELLGVSLGAAVAVRWAAAHPERVRRLVLYGGWADGARVASAAVREHVLGLVGSQWGLGSDVLTDIFAPDADRTTRRAFARYQREAATAERARDMLATCYAVDVTGVLAQVRAPTLVVHRDRDRAAPVQQGQALADGIPGARFRTLPGHSHLPFVGDAEALSRTIRGFLGLPPSRRPATASLTPRQREVAVLVAQGLTNREIGERLVISERSAESHVERIRIRLGLRSRAQVAAWVVGSGAE
jgi:pimeloyl-ACP methyl ester carboxylesterase/DNA-binding CsgD family transcriptional regulator